MNNNYRRMKKIFNLDLLIFSIIVLLFSIPDISYQLVLDSSLANKIVHVINVIAFEWFLLFIVLHVLPFKNIVLKFIILITVIFVPINLLFIFNYGLKLNEAFIYATINANKEELLMYIYPYGVIYFIVLLLFILVSYNLDSSINLLFFKNKLILFASILGFTILNIGYNTVNHLPLFSVSKTFVSERVPYFYYKVWEQYNNEYSIDYSIPKKKFSSVRFFSDSSSIQTLNKRNISILVIGESSRADHWQENGYNRETSPLINNRVYSFNNCYTSSGYTSIAVPLMLRRTNYKNEIILKNESGIIGLFNQLNYKTIWIGNQSIKGYATIRYISDESDVSYNMDIERIKNKKLSIYDESMIGYLKQEIENCDNDIFAVIHLHGNHNPYETSYPKKFDHFKPSAKQERVIVSDCSKSNLMINTYDNSIRYNDFVLNEIINLIDKKDNISSLLFVSDHGDNICEDNQGLTGHGDMAFTEYVAKVPLFIFLNDVYKKTYPSKVRNIESNLEKKVGSAISIFYSLSSLSNIKYDGYIYENDITSSNYSPVKIKFKNDSKLN